jgi:hypothetical protein
MPRNLGTEVTIDGSSIAAGLIIKLGPTDRAQARCKPLGAVMAQSAEGRSIKSILI